MQKNFSIYQGLSDVSQTNKISIHFHINKPGETRNRMRRDLLFLL